jgi:hypothetical protein
VNPADANAYDFEREDSKIYHHTDTVDEQQIFIKTLTGKNLTIDFEDNVTTIHDVKGVIQDREGFPPDIQHLLHEGKYLRNDRLVS